MHKGFLLKLLVFVVLHQTGLWGKVTKCYQCSFSAAKANYIFHGVCKSIASTL